MAKKKKDYEQYTNPLNTSPLKTMILFLVIGLLIIGYSFLDFNEPAYEKLSEKQICVESLVEIKRYRFSADVYYLTTVDGERYYFQPNSEFKYLKGTEGELLDLKYHEGLMGFLKVKYIDEATCDGAVLLPYSEPNTSGRNLLIGLGSFIIIAGIAVYLLNRK